MCPLSQIHPIITECCTSDMWAFGWDQLIGVANVAAVIGAACIGVWGVVNWKGERIETRQAEIGEEALALMYRALEIFDYIRSPGSFSIEGTSRVPQNSDETAEQKQERDYDFIPLERINNEQEFFNKVIEIRPSFKVVFGETSSAPLDKILELRSKIIGSARMMSHMRLRTHFRTDTQHQQHMDRTDENEIILWKDYIKAIDGTKDDPIDVELKQAKKELTTIVSPFLGKRFLHKKS